jgi:Vacuolar import and degradation protein
MRWKERFLVPDHRLKTINGASYAGFYYICVEFGSLMGGLHSDALNPHAADEMEEDDVDSAMAEDGWSLPESGSSRTRGPRRSSSRAHSSSIRTSSTSRRAEDKSPPRAHTIGYTHGQSPYAASSSHAPSTSPVTGANRIARAHPTTGRRRRLSIFTAGSVHSHVHEHGHGHSHGSPSYVPSGYGVGSPPFESGSSELASRHLLASRELELELNAVEDREMGLEEALGLDPVEELRRHRRREVERTEMDRSRSRSARRRDDECDDAKEYGYGYARRGTGWMGPARLTGYYNHSEKDNCDL